jgi:hypothetical protein
VDQRGFRIAIDAQHGRYNVSICFLGAKIPCSLRVEAASLFGEGQRCMLIPCYQGHKDKRETGQMWWPFVVVSIGSIPLAVSMARYRARSPRLWFWVAFLVGPFAPLALVALGRSQRVVAAN